MHRTTHVASSWRAALAIQTTVLALSACAFGSYDPVVTIDELGLTQPGVLALTADNHTAFAYETLHEDGALSRSIRALDTHTGLTVATQPLGDTGPWVQGFAPSWTVTDQIWVLESSGAITRRSVDAAAGTLVTEAQLWAPADRGVMTTFCDLDSTPAGQLYVTTLVEHDGLFVHRWDPDTGWSQVAGPLTWTDPEGAPRAAKCARVSQDRVDAVMLMAYDSVHVYVEEGDGLTHAHTMFLDVPGETTRFEDIAAYGGVAAVAGTDILTATVPVEPSSGVMLLDAYTGTWLDEVWVDGPTALAMAIPEDIVQAGQGMGAARRAAPPVEIRDTDLDTWLWAAGIIDWQTKCETPGGGREAWTPCTYTLARFQLLTPEL